MKAIELESIMSDTTQQGIGAEKSINVLGTGIAQLSKQVRQLENELISMQAVFESAIRSGVNQTDNLAMIHTLRQEITETKNELQDMNSETQKATKTDVKPTAPENSNKNVNFETTTKALEGLNTGMDVAIASASLLGVEHNRLTQIQAKLQAAITITNGLKKIAVLLDGEGIASTGLLARAKGMLTAANVALATSLGISTVAAQALMATLTLGLSVVITGLIWAWNEYSDSQAKAREEAESFRTKVADMSSSSVADFKRLNKEYEELGSNLEAKKKFVNENQEAFNKLGISITDVNDAENLFNNGGAAFITSLTLRAKAAAAMEMATEKYKQAIKSHMEAQAMPDTVTYYTTQGMYGPVTAQTVKNQKKTQAYWDYKNLSDEGDSFIRQSITYSNQSNSIQKKANIKSTDEAERKKKEKEEKAKALEQARTQANAERKERENLMRQAAEAEMRARQQYDNMIIAAMEEGTEKKRAQTILNWEREVENIRKEQQSRLELNKQIRKKGGAPQQTDEAINKDAENKMQLADEVMLKQLDNIDNQDLSEKKAKTEQLLSNYKNAAQQRLDIEKKFNKDIEALKNAEGIDAEQNEIISNAIVIAEEAKAKTLEELDRIQANKDANFQAYMSKMADMGLDQLQKALSEAENAMQQSQVNGDDKSQTIARAKVAALKEKVTQVQAENAITPKDDSNKWKKNGESIKKCKDEIDKMIGSMSFLDENTKAALQTASNVAGGTIAMIDGIQALSKAAVNSMGAVEKASVVLAIIGAAVQAITAIFSFSSAAEKRHQQALEEIAKSKLATQREYNLLLLKENLLMKEASNIFGEQQILKAANAVEVYRDALSQFKESMQGEVPVMNRFESMTNDAGGTYQKRLKDYEEGIGALSQISIKTGHEKTGLFGWGKGKDIYTEVLDIYPDLITKENKLNIERAKSIINTQTMSDENKYLLQNLIDLQEQADEAQNSLRDYLQQTFGGLGDGILDSITESIKSGNDAWESFGDKGSEVLENLGRQIAYSIFFAGKFDALQSKLEAIYGSGKDEKEIAYEAMNEIGNFYAGIGTEMDKAKEFLENWQTEADQKGFDLWETEGSAQQSPQSAAFSTMSQEQGTKLEGLFTSVQDHVSGIDTNVADISKSMYEASDSLAVIARNTSYCHHLEQMAQDISELKRDGIKMK